MPSDAQHTRGRDRVVVINWDPEDIGLLRSLERACADVELICVGHHDPRYIDRSIESETSRPQFIYRRGQVDNESIDRFSEFLARELEIHSASAVIVLPHHGRSEPDAFSRLACAAIKRACGDEPVPNIVVAVDDPEAAFEFAGHGVATIFYDGFLRSALMAHACVDLAVFRFLVELIERRHSVRLLPIPEGLRSKSFRDACVELERDDAGRPITLLGLYSPPSHGERAAGSRLRLNPGPRTPLRDAAGLVALTASPRRA
ncbi:MAG: hypothetical protein H6713_12315 [Myxococcales bacterium]|nr:hypothetical protein [Myxococcales bacterium]MCB9750761.1 hypothetical protein [Myxococcales bacterium]